ncbi:MAG: DUF2723 domain-containing protein [Bacteroidaceae bacterium]|nr:DUF2723 domain-containing protein [Bacteroidaceae bacterium]
MKSYKTVNNLFGWLCFFVAAVTYCLTVEPTASFWDCPEFILSGNKLEIGHPPGAPFFMLTANFFSLFASPEKVALMVNIMSAILSAAGIMFLFWSITHLVRKLIVTKGSEMTTSQMITIIGSGLVGALAYTWSDTYWFSAVEGEVYGYSSLFTAVVFWLILKWEENADAPHSDRWLILIAYLVGLSIGVHLLNLLCIPAIVLVAYYRKAPKATLKGSLIALALSMVLVAAVLYGIVPGVVKVGGWFELFFVNTLGMPFNTGLIIYIILLLAALIWGIYESETGKSRKRLVASFLTTVGLLGIPFYGYGFTSILIGIVVLAALAYLLFRKMQEKYIVSIRTLNTSLLCMMLIMIGYSSYALIVVRSAANTPMDQNSPEDIFSLGKYLGREQYGDRPLFYGPAYGSEPLYKQVNRDKWQVVTKDISPEYGRKEKSSPDEKDSYELLKYKFEYVYAQNMLLPRMYDKRFASYGSAGNLYEKWVGGKIGRNIKYYVGGHEMNVVMPTQWDNLRFFLNYQLNYMYWRYFFWNFVGRQNDLQGHGNLDRGNWITGFKFIDNLLVGNQDKLPKAMKENKGRNVFFALPLILGILGLLWQCKKGDAGIRQFWVVFFLFFMTGIAIVLYLNQTPMQPRERDYAYAGSFYAFAIWIGMGVAAITEWFKKKNTAISAAVAAAALLVPVQMVSQTWDDHDRSGRYACRDFGQNYLNSISQDKNPIIFTCGDNDTFPLWYNQEVEGVRTDARVCNLSYLHTDWYIDQMRRPAYDSPSLPISWNRIDYAGKANDYVYVKPEKKEMIKNMYAQNPEKYKKALGENPFEVKNIMKYWVRNQDERVHYIPTDTLYIRIDKEAVYRSGMLIPREYRDTMPEYMVISLKGRDALARGDLMLLEMLSEANWERPLYMSRTVGDDNYLASLQNFFVTEGLASRITPFDWKKLGYSNEYETIVDTEKVYDNVMNRFKFGGLAENPDYYLDETTMRMVYTHRVQLASLAERLIVEGKKEKALEVLEYAEKMIPGSLVPHSTQMGAASMGSSYILLGEKSKAMSVIEPTCNDLLENIQWYESLSNRHQRAIMSDYGRNLNQLLLMTEVLSEGGDAYKEEVKRYKAEFNKHYSIWKAKQQGKRS